MQWKETFRKLKWFLAFHIFQLFYDPSMWDVGCVMCDVCVLFNQTLDWPVCWLNFQIIKLQVCDIRRNDYCHLRKLHLAQEPKTDRTLKTFLSALVTCSMFIFISVEMESLYSQFTFNQNNIFNSINCWWWYWRNRAALHLTLKSHSKIQFELIDANVHSKRQSFIMQSFNSMHSDLISDLNILMCKPALNLNLNQWTE